MQARTGAQSAVLALDTVWRLAAAVLLVLALLGLVSLLLLGAGGPPETGLLVVSSVALVIALLAAARIRSGRALRWFVDEGGRPTSPEPAGLVELAWYAYQAHLGSNLKERLGDRVELVQAVLGGLRAEAGPRLAGLHVVDLAPDRARTRFDCRVGRDAAFYECWDWRREAGGLLPLWTLDRRFS
jgi:hypothetical protein